MERYHWIDVVKGLAIFLVVVGHVGGIYGGESASWSFNVIHTFIYSFHMPLFMFVSGYLFTSSLNKDYKTTALSKLISYGVPYIVFSIVYWAMKAVGGAFVNNTVSIMDLFLIPLFPLSFMWYIYALLIMVELTLLIGRRDKRVVLAVAVVCRIVWEVLTTARGFTESWANDLIVTDFINNYIWFALGMIYGGELMTRLKGMRTSDIYFISVVGFIILLIATVIGLAKIPFLRILWGAIGILSTIAVGMVIDKNVFLEYMGRNTVQIYLIHGL